MTAATLSQAAPDLPQLPAREAVYRDDGLLANTLGSLARRAPALPLLLAGTLGVLALIAATGGDASNGVAAAGVAWVVLLNGLTCGSWPRQSFHWAVPPLVRLGEYATLVWIGALADAPEGAFALLAALTFRHYDLVYRLRHRAEVPPVWLNLLAAGWEGRLIIAWVLLAVGALPEGMFIWAGLLAVVSVTETVAAWRRFNRFRRPAEYDDVEDED